jgi:hypothetical protein
VSTPEIVVPQASSPSSESAGVGPEVPAPRQPPPPPPPPPPPAPPPAPKALGSGLLAILVVVAVVACVAWRHASGVDEKKGHAAPEPERLRERPYLELELIELDGGSTSCVPVLDVPDARSFYGVVEPSALGYITTGPDGPCFRATGVGHGTIKVPVYGAPGENWEMSFTVWRRGTIAEDSGVQAYARNETRTSSPARWRYDLVVRPEFDPGMLPKPVDLCLEPVPGEQLVVDFDPTDGSDADAPVGACKVVELGARGVELRIVSLAREPAFRLAWRGGDGRERFVDVTTVKPKGTEADAGTGH